MSFLKRKRSSFRPTLTDAGLEERVVLSSPGGFVTIGNGTPVFLPANSSNLTAPTTSSSGITLTAAQLRSDFTKQLGAASRSFNSMVHTASQQLFANGATPSAQALANFNAQVGGAVDALALRLSSQAALLPNSSQLVNNIEKALLGSGANSLTNKLTSTALSTRFNGSVNTLTRALSTEINTMTLQNSSRLNQFFNTTSLNKLSVNSSGQHIPLAQFVGNQLVNQFANNLGSLANNFPTVANSALFPNGSTATPSQSALNAFNTQANNALSTAAFQLGSGLSLFPGSSNVVSMIQPVFFGSGANANSLSSALSNLQFGSSNFNTNVSTAFTNAFQSSLTPLQSFFGISNPNGTSNTFFPTNPAETFPFGPRLGGSSLAGGFNNGFTTSTNTNANSGFVGFGQAPTTFNTGFGTGFNTFVSALNMNSAFTPTSTASNGA